MQLPEFKFEGTQQPRTLPQKFPSTPLQEHLTARLLERLVATVATTWLCSNQTSEQKTLAKELDTWRSTMKTHFDSTSLDKLHINYGNFGRIAILHIFEFSLFQVVKEEIAKNPERGIEDAVAKLTKVSLPSL